MAGDGASHSPPERESAVHPPGKKREHKPEPVGYILPFAACNGRTQQHPEKRKEKHNPIQP